MPDKNNALRDFLGRFCRCGRLKDECKSHCRACYFKLPRDIRRALYRRFGQGYEQAYSESLEYLDTLEKRRAADA